MPTLRRAVSVLLSGSAIIALTPLSAQAQYLDPGAGSIILQVVIAVVVGASATLRLYWHRISPFIRRKKNRDEP